MHGIYEEPKSAHVVVVANEKGGSGKSTISMHLIVALLNAGQSVASIDLDARQGSLSRYVENRRRTSLKLAGGTLGLPEHFAIGRGEGQRVAEREAAEFGFFADVLEKVQRRVDFLVIDTPATDSYLMQLAHSMADTLISPMNDSYVDFDVLGRVDPVTGETVEIGQYGKLVREAARKRRLIDGRLTDWVVLRNRLTQFDSHNKRRVHASLKALTMQLGFRLHEGLSERVVFRELFPLGLTALDPLDAATLGREPSFSHLAARQEIRSLLADLRLPIDEKGRRRAEAREAWARSRTEPLEHQDIFVN
ncbi:MAG: division plane positioning ATPase MipZ [Hyphomicrobiales bacterium]